VYSIDGIPLVYPELGWRFKRGSEPSTSRSFNRADFNASNRDGTVSVRGNQATPTLTLVATAPTATVEGLRRLFRLGSRVTLTANGSTFIAVEAMTVTHRTITPAGPGLHEITVVYRCPDVWWRDVNPTDWSASLSVTRSAGAANLTVVSSSSAAVTDALVVVQGGVAAPRIAAQNGSFMQLEANLLGSWVRFDTVRGRCWVGNNGLDPWNDTSNEQTSALDTGAGPYYLELAPTSAGPSGATLTVSWDSVVIQSAITVRARNAYDR
jgi:hypothetical protein